MKVIITGKQMDIKEDVKSYAEAHLTFGKRKKGKFVVLDATIFYNSMIFRAETENHDIYMIIDKAVTIIERQIRKNKTKLEKRLHDKAFEEYQNEEELEQTQHKIVKLKKFSIKPMSVEEAMLQMDLIGHQFFIFLNSETEKSNVIYKRNNGNYGLIEPEV